MDLLTPFQQEILRAVGRSPLGESFYLTGGTALSAFYLFHRYSEDLDFFTPEPDVAVRVPPILETIAPDVGASVTFTRPLGSFLECFLERDSGERVNLDFAQDSPYRLMPIEFNDAFGVKVDNATDIATNKLSALFDRAEPKDFVDIYFICQELMPFEELDRLARQKYVGIDDYWLAAALRRAEHVALLPRMIKPLDMEEMRAFFVDLANLIMGRIDPGTAE